MIKLYVRCAILAIAALVLAGCQTNEGPQRLGGGSIAQSTSQSSWKEGVGYGFAHDELEPSQPSWAKPVRKRHAPKSRIAAIRQMARGLAPRGVDITKLSGMVGKRRQAKIGCIPSELRMILNTVAWHYGKKVHIQSGFRSKHYNRRVGGARRSLHVACKAVDIQVAGVNKYKLAKFLKKLPGRGGVGTYCNTSTVHIDVGAKRSWHYGCGRKSKARRRLARYKRKQKQKRRRHRSYK